MKLKQLLLHLNSHLEQKKQMMKQRQNFVLYKKNRISPGNNSRSSNNNSNLFQMSHQFKGNINIDMEEVQQLCLNLLFLLLKQLRLTGGDKMRSQMTQFKSFYSFQVLSSSKKLFFTFFFFLLHPKIKIIFERIFNPTRNY
jgi:hypothetical protein